MLTDEKFIEETFINNLYYLRTLREFCTRVELSLPSIYENYIEEAKSLGKRCENLGSSLAFEANGSIKDDVLKKEVFVTKYTLDLEKLTNKLFGYNQNIDITNNELKLTEGKVLVTLEKLAFANSLNDSAFKLANDFIRFSNDLYEKVKNQEVFTFYYNSLNELTVYEIKVYLLILERLINKSSLDPVFVIDYEYGFNQLLKGIATFIRGELDPVYTDFVLEAQGFVLEYTNLITEYENVVITPNTQSNMTSNSLELARRFKTFLEKLITSLLKKEIYFISPPITKDNALTDINFFIYNLEENIKSN